MIRKYQMKYSLYISFALITAGITGCKDTYYINVEDNKTVVLVVEGMITDNSTPTIIKLSYSVPVNSTMPSVINYASVVIESNDGASYVLPFDHQSLDYRANIAAVPGKEYRVKILIAEDLYESAWVPLLETPAITDVGFDRNYGGMNIRISTGDPSGNIRFYRWTFEEDWEINSAVRAQVRYDQAANIVEDYFGEESFICYRHAESQTLLLGSSADLSENVINNRIIHWVNETDDRMSVRYSINVKQHAISSDAYKFYDVMRKITENMGSIFDPQPAELAGNITCMSDPEKRVIGHVYAATEQTKRLFISSSEATDWKFRMQCEYQNIANTPSGLRTNYPYPFLPYLFLDVQSNTYPSATSNCVDCRLRGGTNNKPSFW